MSTAHSDVFALLDRLKVSISASEAHGLLCGLLCCQTSEAAKTRWFSELIGTTGLSAAAIGDNAGDLRALDAWFTEVLEALNHAELEFTPLLPDDEQHVTERVVSLSDFCGGFTYGFGIGASGRGSRPLPDDTVELLQDFQAIEAAEPDAGITDDEQEATLVELLEYVRVGVLLIHEECHPVAAVAGNPAKPRVH